MTAPALAPRGDAPPPARGAPVVALDGVSIGYAARGRGGAPSVVARGITLDLRAGELVCLLGPNGAGKSTLINTLTGGLRPLAGAVRLAGDDVHALPARELARRVSVVLTDRVDAGALTAYDLAALGRHPHTDWLGRLGEADHAAVRAALASAGAAALAGRLVGELSDGERQRVMLARALAQEAPLLVLDEITAFLDLPRRVEVMRILRALAHHEGRTVLLSTHDLDLALRTADRIWLLPKGTDGAPAALHDGAPEDLVLGGAFEAAFGGAGVAFDRATGTFRMREPHGARVLLDARAAAPALRFWTAHALERAGYTVVDGDDAHEAAAARVTVDDAADAPRWHVATGNAATEHATLAAVVARLSAPGRAR